MGSDRPRAEAYAVGGIVYVAKNVAWRGRAGHEGLIEQALGVGHLAKTGAGDAKTPAGEGLSTIRGRHAAVSGVTSQI